jgi:signal transduction histidine kinase
MDLNTLTLYLVAGAVSFGLCIVLLVGARLRPDARLLKSCAGAIALLSLGFVVSGFGLSLPRWMTVMGTNMVLLSAGAVFYAGFCAYYHDRAPVFDRVGWGVVALTAMPFWYWGLVEPDGHYRAAVFSFANAVINVRTAGVLIRTAAKTNRTVPVWVLAALFSVASVWMAARGIASLLESTPPVSQRGANPTSWITVFWYIIMVSLLSLFVFWMEFTHRAAHRAGGSVGAGAAFSLVRYFSNRLLLLWSVITILLLGAAGGLGLMYAKSFDWESARLTHAAEASNDAFVHHSLQVFSQVDTVLQAVRGYYLQSRSIALTERFIQGLPFDRANFGNVYLINPTGTIVISHDPEILGRTVTDRDYFLFHSTHSEDRIFIGSVEVGRITGKLDFRVTRRINNPDGSFAGVVLATVNPETLSRYYSELAVGSQNVAALIGTLDQKIRARNPAAPLESWQTRVDSPLWNALTLRDSGRYTNASAVDGVPRTFTYKQVGDLPLVMVTGFSERDLSASVRESVQWAVLGAITAAVAMLVLAALLTIEIRRRNEQDKFLSMLSHELKTPLSVLRMALGTEGSLSANTRKHAQQSVQDMDTIIYRCLQVDRLQHKGHPQVAQACQVGEVLSALQTASMAPERLQISAQALPMLHTDPQLLSIALNNLMDNALKYAAPHSEIRVSACQQMHKRSAGILITVANTAGSAGMPDAGKVFKKYYRGARAHSMTGSGLGLYLVHTVARLLGGWVRYAPQAQEVRFELWVPLALTRGGRM